MFNLYIYIYIYIYIYYYSTIFMNWDFMIMYMIYHD